MAETKAKPRGKALRGKRAGRATGESTRENSKASFKIRFRATVLRRAGAAKAVDWMFLVLPREASAKLPSRGMVSVEGTFGGVAFCATLEPDGEGGHWMRVERKLSEAAGV